MVAKRNKNQNYNQHRCTFIVPAAWISNSCKKKTKIATGQIVNSTRTAAVRERKKKQNELFYFLLLNL